MLLSIVKIASHAMGMELLAGNILAAIEYDDSRLSILSFG
jgi:hypothetical protein